MRIPLTSFLPGLVSKSEILHNPNPGSVVVMSLQHVKPMNSSLCNRFPQTSTTRHQGPIAGLSSTDSGSRVKVSYQTGLTVLFFTEDFASHTTLPSLSKSFT
eukprot:TRINITY_DN11340_c0_g1_i1.p1 TRINITY_DN11340_c0_g1~~TRINITY_DN11340_c0_g1_i1.p1  ORF type:complete len:102 (+),score=9.28 TRINITY_DN11340_c0_g1_i1:54-359(+)